MTPFSLVFAAPANAVCNPDYPDVCLLSSESSVDGLLNQAQTVLASTGADALLPFVAGIAVLVAGVVFAGIGIRRERRDTW